MSLSRLKNIAQNSDDGRWLLHAIASWESGEPLDIALGLCGAAVVSRRNMALKAAADILNEGELSLWRVAGLLACAIRRFETRVLACYQNNENIKLTEIDSLLAVMFEPGNRVIRTQRHIFEIIK